MTSVTVNVKIESGAEFPVELRSASADDRRSRPAGIARRGPMHRAPERGVPPTTETVPAG